jgi:hypothetical protein
MKNGQKLKLGDANVTPRNIQEVQASNLGDAPEAPLLHRQKSSLLCVFLGATLLLLSVFFCFVCCNKLFEPNKFLLEEIYLVFHCQEHSIFHSYRSTSVLFF